MRTVGRTLAVTVTGIEGTVVQVEADIASGLPAFAIGGLPDRAVKQAPDRVRAAAANSGLTLSQQRVTVNLSPASIPKQGTGLDLPIALSVLAARGEPDIGSVIRDVVHLGELGLDGSVRPIAGVLPAVLAAADAGVRSVVVPLANATEAALVPGVDVIPVRSLREIVARYSALTKGRTPPDLAAIPLSREVTPALPDLVDLVGQVEARHALEIAAAGGHHMSMTGPPGAGKTMIAERLPGILPMLNEQESLEVTAIHSVLGVLTDEVLVRRAPFVAPHHGASMAAMVGGGSSRIRPGAISRAHRGCLFLDEGPEYRRDVLEALRQPLESGVVRIMRAETAVTFPARFQLVIASNPCPCGRGDGKAGECTCTSLAKRTYGAKLSGPLMDRVDVHLRVQALTRAALRGPVGESSAQVAARVWQAREAQLRRWVGTPWTLNSQVPGSVLRGEWQLPAEATRELSEAIDRGSISLRGYDRCLRLAWTLSDVEGRDRPEARHVRQALGLRSSEAAA